MEPLDGTQGESTRTPGRKPRRRPLGTLTLIVAVILAGGAWILGVDDGPQADGTAGASQPSQDGESAPDFTATLIGGGSFHLAEHFAEDGRPVVLNLWASWCSPCRAEMPEFDLVSQATPEVFFIGVAVEDDPEAAVAFAAEVGVSYPLALDTEDVVGRSYPALGLPATYFIDSDGRIVLTVLGQLDEARLAAHISEAFGL